MGIVYLARDSVLERPLALKQLPTNEDSPESVQRFRRIGVVTANHEQRLAIGAETQRMRAMLTAATQSLQLLEFAKRSVAVRITRSIQTASGATIDGQVEAVKCPEHALRRGRLDFAFRKVESFNDRLSFTATAIGV